MSLGVFVVTCHQIMFPDNFHPILRDHQFLYVLILVILTTLPEVVTAYLTMPAMTRIKYHHVVIPFSSHKCLTILSGFSQINVFGTLCYHIYTLLHNV